MDPVSKAQGVQSNAKATGKKLGGITGKGFKPGQSGNPGGRPKKKPLTEMFERILANTKNEKDFEKTIVKLVNGGRMASVLMLREMAERVEGKVAQTVEMEVSGKLTLEQVLEAKKKAGK